MIRVLITGKNSYIGSCLKKFLHEFPETYYVEELDVSSSKWECFDFCTFDVIYHVAGIAHMKEAKANENLYFQVNRDLTIEVAEKAKSAGVKKFIFMSSMSVYGLDYSLSDIDITTPVIPNSFYGQSKLEAEDKLKQISSEKFKVCILRPPMVYGKGSPGNMSKLVKTVKRLHVFPKFQNERSSISIHTLVVFVKNVIDLNMEGILFPQNAQYMCTYKTIKEILDEEGIKVWYTSICNPVIKLLIGKIKVISKVFGNLKYKM